MLAVSGDDDFHGAGKASELASAGLWNNDDVELKRTVLHCGVMLKDESAGAAAERTADAFDGDIATGALGRRAGREHFAFARSFQIAVKLLVDRKARIGIFGEAESRIEGTDFDVEGSRGLR